ncbi:MAG TPA: hypothetical protein VGD05_06390 [Pyrinomonadaceae bacterium]
MKIDDEGRYRFKTLKPGAYRRIFISTLKAKPTGSFRRCFSPASRLMKKTRFFWDLQSQSAKSAGTAQTMPPTKEIERDVNF